MKMINQRVVYLVCIVLIIVFQITIHFVMLRGGIGCGTLLAFYTYKDPVSSKGHSDMLDIVLPSVLFGVITGVIGRCWSIRKQAVVLGCGSIGLALLLPFYTLILGENLVWWWPGSRAGAALFVMLEIPKIFVLSCFFVLWVRFIFFRKRSDKEEDGV
jgi:hypothetical protein